MATSAPGLFFVRERLSRRRLLVDTGAEISVIPPVQSDRQRHQCGVHLQAAKGVTIATFFSAFAYSQPAWVFVTRIAGFLLSQTSVTPYLELISWHTMVS